MPAVAKSEKDDDGGAGKVKTDGAVEGGNVEAEAVKGAEPAKTSATYNGGETTEMCTVFQRLHPRT